MGWGYWASQRVPEQRQALVAKRDQRRLNLGERVPMLAQQFTDRLFCDGTKARRTDRHGGHCAPPQPPQPRSPSGAQRAGSGRLPRRAAGARCVDLRTSLGARSRRPSACPSHPPLRVRAWAIVQPSLTGHRRPPEQHTCRENERIQSPGGLRSLGDQEHNSFTSSKGFWALVQLGCSRVVVEQRGALHRDRSRLTARCRRRCGCASAASAEPNRRSHTP